MEVALGELVVARVSAFKLDLNGGGAGVVELVWGERVSTIGGKLAVGEELAGGIELAGRVKLTGGVIIGEVSGDVVVIPSDLVDLVDLVDLYPNEIKMRILTSQNCR